jgi:hypothetical protein
LIALVGNIAVMSVKYGAPGEEIIARIGDVALGTPGLAIRR